MGNRVGDGGKDGVARKGKGSWTRRVRRPLEQPVSANLLLFKHFGSAYAVRALSTSSSRN